MNEISEITDLDVGLNLLRKDEKMSILVGKYRKPGFEIGKDYFHSLLRSIVYQQLSGKSAKAIFDRFIKLVPKKSLIKPKAVLKISDQDMRKAGLSFQKIDYIKNLAQYFTRNSFQAKDLKKMTNEEISLELTKIKGIGQWTVDMFLMFTLNRSDVMPYGDLAIQKGFKKFFNLNHLPSKREMEDFSENWRPFRTLACWYLWETVDDEFDW
tara:strand:+ start:521 stop:1153 length:633 start_codon:yes stop_codon:yes gene_type:complete